MNERIQQLFEQAHIQPPATRSGQFAFTPPKTFSPEKFAELIVRECALTAGLMEHEGRKGIGAQILDNFGVGE